MNETRSAHRQGEKRISDLSLKT